MSDYSVSLRYASSLFDLAIEKKILEAVSKDMDLVYATLDANPQLVRTMASPVVKPPIKLSILEEIFKSRIGADSINFLKFLVHKNREDILQNIIQRFLELRDEHLGIINVDVKTATKFSTKQENELKSRLESFFGKKVRIKFVMESNLLGGFIAKVNDTVFDASINHQLELLKNQFLQGGASLN